MLPCLSIITQFFHFQTEFYLPYSVSEDVDFSISRPEGFGCYRWSVDDKFSDLALLHPQVTNYELKCGNKLVFQVSPRWRDASVDVVITGENVKPETKSNRDTKTKTKSESGMLNHRIFPT